MIFTQLCNTPAQTLFDLASLTKVLATTTAVMILYQRGHLDLGIYELSITEQTLLSSGSPCLLLLYLPLFLVYRYESE